MTSDWAHYLRYLLVRFNGSESARLMDGMGRWDFTDESLVVREGSLNIDGVDRLFDGVNSRVKGVV